MYQIKNSPRIHDSEYVQTRIDYTCHKKRVWRDTVIGVYRELFNRKGLPRDKQYWTIPNKVYDPDFLMGARLLPGCEFHQMIQKGLVTTDQCHGVERIGEIYQNNLKVPGIHSYHGDFLDIMDEQAGLGQFNPGIVMYDSIEYPDTHEDYFPRIMHLLTELGIRDVLVVWNFVIRSRFHRSYTTQGLSNRVHDHYLMSLTLDKAEDSGYPWEYLPYAITYRGSGKGHQSTMATAFYYRK